MGWLLLRPFKVLVTYPIQRQGEFEADDIGFKIVSKAKYDQGEALSFWDKLERLDPSIRGFQYFYCVYFLESLTSKLVIFCLLIKYTFDSD